jgi:NAD(P)-dependent dehydrogenase (short-subunit alcohol dehydrogenase family)
VNDKGLGARRALVTGGASGIGAAVARQLAALGAAGVIIDVVPAELVEPPPGWIVLTADVRHEPEFAAAVRQAANHLGGLDGVVAAAGVVPAWQPIAELDLDDFDRVLAINVRGVIATIKHARPLLASPATITVVGSVNSWRGDPQIASYVASKHAVLGLIRSAALALGASGVRVNGVGPGPVATDALLSRMAARQHVTGLSVDAAIAAAGKVTALGRIATVDEVVAAIVFLTSECSSGITGQLLNVDCGIL